MKSFFIKTGLFLLAGMFLFMNIQAQRSGRKRGNQQQTTNPNQQQSTNNNQQPSGYNPYGNIPSYVTSGNPETDAQILHDWLVLKGLIKE